MSRLKRPRPRALSHVTSRPFGAGFFFILTLSLAQPGGAQTGNNIFTIARLKYQGGGDWYNNPSIIPNMLNFLSQHTTLNVSDSEARVSPLDEQLFSYPFLFMTGHGKISFSEREAERLRSYLVHGGFLFAEPSDPEVTGYAATAAAMGFAVEVGNATAPVDDWLSRSILFTAP